MPLLTITLNPAVDKIYTVPGFQAGGVFRPTETRVYAGGKGINAARVFHTLGGETTATGFLGGSNGEYVRDSLRGECLVSSFTPIAGESRVCSMIVNPVGKTETVLNEAGPEVTPSECGDFLDGLRELLPAHSVVLLSGSAPASVPPGFYGDIIRLVQECGFKIAVDASGEALQAAAVKQPFLLKPNADELKALAVGGDGWGGSVQALREQFGLTLGMITAGPRGAVAASAGGVWQATPPPIDLVSATGSGDSLTGAFLWALEEGWSVPDALKLGVAAGAANATVYGSGFCTRDQIFTLFARTVTEWLG